MKNKDRLKEYIKTKLDKKHKIKKLFDNYKLLGYSDIDAIKKIWDYLLRTRKYNLIISFRRILIELGYYKKATPQDLIKDIKKKNPIMFKDKFEFYYPVMSFNEWLEKETE